MSIIESSSSIDSTLERISAVQRIVRNHSKIVLDTIKPSEEDRQLMQYLGVGEKDLFLRLQNLDGNSFHNMNHALAVHRRLWSIFQGLNNKNTLSLRKMLLMSRAALSHDDGHCGETYRQNVVGGAEMSNEEWSAHLLESDLVKNNISIPPEDLIFMKRLILGTTFAQGKPFLAEDDPKYRPYKADTVEEKLLVFADVGGAYIDDWTQWRNEGLQVIQETGKYPKSIEEWLKSRRIFLLYIKEIYDDIQTLLTPEFQKKVEENYMHCLKKLDEIEKLPYCEESLQICEMLNL